VRPDTLQSNHYTFVGGTLGLWEVASMTPVRGQGRDPAARVEVSTPVSKPCGGRKLGLTRRDEQSLLYHA
jgi:hypothetical protein